MKLLRHLVPGGLSLIVAIATLAAEKRPGLPEITVTGGFRSTIYDREKNRPAAVVTGKEAKPLVGGQMSISGFKLETFQYQPESSTELIVESSTAAFGSSQGATSDKDITIRHADGRFQVTGRGWLWDQATGLLVVSNDVKAVLRRTGGGTNREPVQITSARLEYNLKSGDTRFLRECVAIEPGSARITAGEIVSQLGAAAEKPQAITARENVVIELTRPGREGRATGQTAEYRSVADGEEIRLTGSPAWDMPMGAGSAQTLTLLPGKDSYVAEGEARLRLWPRNPGKEGDAPTRSKVPIDIQAARVAALPGKVSFEGPLTMVQSNRLELQAAHAEVRLASKGGNGEESVEGATATGDVVARLPSRGGPLELRGGEMIYGIGEHPFIEIGQQPTWRGAQHSGRGRRFYVHPDQSRFQVVDDVEVEWNTSGKGTNTIPVRLTAAGMVVQENEAQFIGDVRLKREDWELRGNEVALLLGTNSILNRLRARRNVELEYSGRVTPSGSNTNAPRTGIITAFVEEVSGAVRQWKITGTELEATFDPRDGAIDTLEAKGGVRVEHFSLHAQGEKIVFAKSDGVLRLTGDAQLTTAQGAVIVAESGSALALDPRLRQFRVEGPTRRFTLPSRTFRGTNAPPVKSPLSK